jgi:hypothetical protein
MGKLHRFKSCASGRGKPAYSVGIVVGGLLKEGMPAAQQAVDASLRAFILDNRFYQ